VDARDLESALAQIGTLNAPELAADRHPERRLKASYKVCFYHTLEREFQLIGTISVHAASAI